jgi:ribose transport system permease protein
MSALVQRAAGLRTDEAVVRLIPYVLLVLLVVVLAALEPASLSVDATTRIVDISVVLILVGVGQTIVMLSGGIDLSVGGVISLVTAIAATRMSSAGAAWAVAAGLLALGWLPGLLNGALIVYGRLQPFIVTLGTWFVLGGLSLVVLPSAGGTVSGAFGWIASGALLGLGNSIWITLLAGVAAWWLLQTRLGLEIRAIGSDREAAHQSGVPVRRVTLLTYCLASEFAVLAGLVLASSSLSGDPTGGDTYILMSVAAAVIGGTSLFGGRGTTTGTIVGALVLSYLLSVVFALDVPSQWSLIASGALLIISQCLQDGARRLLSGRRRDA